MPAVLQTLILIVSTGLASGNDYISACYFASWRANSANSNIRLPISDIDPSLCTHLIYAFAKFDLDSLKIIPATPIIENSLAGRQGLYAKFNLLKERNSNLKTLLSIGGQNANIDNYARLASNPESVNKFAKHAASFLRRQGFNGLDIDWEYPTNVTKYAYSQLLKGVSEAFDEEARASGKRRLLLTVSVSGGKERIEAGYEIAAISRSVDFIFVMAYDFFGSWSKVTGFNSPLRTRHDPSFSQFYNVEYAVMKWVEGGADKKKVILGMTGAGASFTYNNSMGSGVGSPVLAAGTPGALFHTTSRLIYQEICLLINGGWQKEWDTEQQVPYAYNEYQWVGYDDTRSIKEKVTFAKDRGLGGVMFWELSFDDPRGMYCHEGKFPLLSTAKKILGIEGGGGSLLTKDVDPWIILLTKAAAPNLYHSLITISFSLALSNLVVCAI